ncbi:hypothetical protein SAVIM40S_02980 [Streptomyces avidinii]
MLAERRTGRLLGVQIVGGAGAAKRVDVAAVALTAGMTVDQVVSLDLGYAPPFSPSGTRSWWRPAARCPRSARRGVTLRAAFPGSARTRASDAGGADIALRAVRPRRVQRCVMRRRS